MVPPAPHHTPDSVPQLIELKNGFCYNGLLVNCDKFMNVNLKDVTLTSKVSSSAQPCADRHVRRTSNGCRPRGFPRLPGEGG